MRGVIESIIFLGREYFSYMAVEKENPEIISAHTLEIAAERALRKQRAQTVEFECMGRQAEVRFTPDKLARGLEEPRQKERVKEPRPVMPRATQPRLSRAQVSPHLTDLLRQVNTFNNRLDALSADMAALRREYQAARVRDVVRFKAPEAKAFALQTQLQEVMGQA